jgi:hypothetical protein
MTPTGIQTLAGYCLQSATKTPLFLYSIDDFFYLTGRDEQINTLTCMLQQTHTTQTAQHNTTQHKTTQHNTTQHNTTQHNTYI